MPRVRPWAEHFLPIGHSAAAFSLPRGFRLLYSSLSGPECDSNHRLLLTIYYLHNGPQDRNAAFMLHRAPYWLSYIALYRLGARFPNGTARLELQSPHESGSIQLPKRLLVGVGEHHGGLLRPVLVGSRGSPQAGAEV